MDKTTLLLFGVTGDLARRMVIPSIYALFKSKKIKNMLIIGAAPEDMSAAEVLERARPFISSFDPKVWKALTDSFFFQQLDAENEQDFAILHEFVKQKEKEKKFPGNRLFYCAVAAQYFCPITRNATQVSLLQRLDSSSSVWHRVIYEKPFGHDAASAREINACIKESINESQVYRIDHYLTKEIVSNIALIRFTNCVFEPLWNNRYIDNVQIILSESVCMEGRGAYFDTYGAVSDVVQNHMLQLLSLIAMEAPEQLKGEYIRDKRAQVLEKVKVIDALYGQYEGYQNEPGVKENSKTETFVMAALEVNNARWSGVPFYLKTGKCLDKKETVIHIKFKQVDCLLATCPIASNYLTIQVSPEAIFSLSLNAKKPGVNEVVPVKMEFCHSCIFGESTPEAYEVLLEEVIRGQQSVSVRFDEIEQAWNIIDTIKQKEIPLYIYEPGSMGPEEVTDFENKHGMRWRS